MPQIELVEISCDPVPSSYRPSWGWANVRFPRRNLRRSYGLRVESGCDVLAVVGIVECPAVQELLDDYSGIAHGQNLTLIHDNAFPVGPDRRTDGHLLAMRCP